MILIKVKCHFQNCFLLQQLSLHSHYSYLYLYLTFTFAFTLLLSWKNIQSLAMKLFKVKRNLSNVVIWNVLKARKLISNLRSQTNFVTDCVNTRRYFVPKVCDIVSSERKECSLFKNVRLRFKNRLQKTVLAIFVGHTYRI